MWSCAVGGVSCCFFLDCDCWLSSAVLFLGSEAAAAIHLVELKTLSMLDISLEELFR
jgi:hypothetical protein